MDFKFFYAQLSQSKMRLMNLSLIETSTSLAELMLRVDAWLDVVSTMLKVELLSPNAAALIVKEQDLESKMTQVLNSVKIVLPTDNLL